MQVIKQKDLIWGLLLNNPRFRDNDQALISHIWSLEIPNLQNVDGAYVLTLLANKQLSNPVSIWRTRQKVQQEIPALRGALYHKRHAAAEVVKKEIVNQQIDLINAIHRANKEA
tara:strand:- start:1452 stop:1793 length:342 start_codon:yes stop_codon:yes gene_type:complete